MYARLPEPSALGKANLPNRESVRNELGVSVLPDRLAASDDSRGDSIWHLFSLWQN